MKKLVKNGFTIKEKSYVASALYIRFVEVKDMSAFRNKITNMYSFYVDTRIYLVYINFTILLNWV